MKELNEKEKIRKKDSARLTWDTKPRRAPNPKDIEFQTAEVVIPNPQHAGQLPLSFRDGLIGEEEIDKQKMNRLIWGDNLLVSEKDYEIAQEKLKVRRIEWRTRPNRPRQRRAGTE